MKQVKNVAYILFKIFSILLMLVTTAGIVRGYYFFLWELPDSINRPYDYYRDRIPKVYQKAGFTGKVSNFEHAVSLHKSVLLYTYTEKIGEEEVRYPISLVLDSDEQEGIPEYSLPAIVDMYTGLEEGHLQDGALFSTFFRDALVENVRLNVFRADLIKALELLNAEEVTVSFSYNHENNSESLKNVNKELKSDIASAMQKGASPISAIRQLDPFKYIKLGYIKVTISADFKGKSFEDYLERIDKRFFKPGYYEVHFTEEEAYSKFLINDQLEWTNITSTD